MALTVPLYVGALFFLGVLSWPEQRKKTEHPS
jgi:hypothetical protein